MRGIDHLVLPVNDLGAARKTFTSLGFTATPDARHPFGTGNFLVQLQNCFLEFVAVLEPDKLPAASTGDFSFGCKIEQFLDRYGEGFAMLVLDSVDAVSDRKAFIDAGLQVYPPFSFERTAKLPDGTPKKVAFSLTIVGNPATPDQGYFTCQQHYPENFWKPDYQRHANGAKAIGSVIMICDDVENHIDFFQAFAGSTSVAREPGKATIATSRGDIVLLTPHGFEAVFGMRALDEGARSGQLPQFIAYEISVGDIGQTAACLKSAGTPYMERGNHIIVAPDGAHGATLMFLNS